MITPGSSVHRQCRGKRSGRSPQRYRLSSRRQTLIELSDFINGQLTNQNLFRQISKRSTSWRYAYQWRMRGFENFENKRKVKLEKRCKTEAKEGRNEGKKKLVEEYDVIRIGELSGKLYAGGQIDLDIDFVYIRRTFIIYVHTVK